MPAEGMVLSQDIMTSTGHLIAAKDTVLTLDMIAKISEYNVLKINVYDGSCRTACAAGSSGTDDLL